MHRFSLSFSFVLLCLLTGSLSAKHNGDYLIKLSDEYVTPHYSFVTRKDPRPLRTLFIMRRYGARDAIEIIQRMPMQAEYFLTANAGVIAYDDMYESTVEGTSTFEKTQELNRKLRAQYDLCIIGGTHLEFMPPQAQYRILKAVQKGMGLIVVNVHFTGKLPYARMIRQPLQVPAFAKTFAQPGKHMKMEAWQMDKGRIVALSWDPTRYGLLDLSGLPAIPYSNQWKTQHENASAFMGMVCRFAAGRDLKPAEPVKIRYRNRWNQEVPKNQLPAGAAYRDELGANGAFHVSEIMIPSPVGRMTLEVPEEIRDKGPIEGRIALEKPVSGKHSIRVELLDSPYGRIWYRRDSRLKSGSSEFSFRIEKYSMPTLAGYVRITLKGRGGSPDVVTEKPVFFPDDSVDDYARMAWDTVRGTTGELTAPQIVDRLGWRMGLTHPAEDGSNVRDMALLNQKMVCYTTRIYLSESPTHGVKQYMWFFIPPKDQKKVKELKGDECFYRPEVQKLWAAGVERRMAFLPKYSTAIYNLGDENGFNYDAGFGPSDLIYFRKFLEKRYQTIGNLNRHYKSSYQSFDQVPHLTQKQARAAGNYSAWADHRAYMEKMYADVHAFLRREIKKYSPTAKVGAEGSEPGDLEQTIDSLEYWGPYSDIVGDELLRSFGRKKIRMLWWGGYPGAHGARSPYPLPLLNDLLLGTVNGSAWYISVPGDNHSSFNCDFSLAAYVKNYLWDFDRLAGGAAQLMIRNPLMNNGIAFYWSHPSYTASQATGKGLSPKDGIMPMISTAYRYGFGFEFVSERTLDRLKNVKFLILPGAAALSDRECRALLEFVRNGGVIMADTAPALMNETMLVREKNPLAPLFGDCTFASLPAEPPVKAVRLPGLNSLRVPVFGKIFQERRYGMGRAYLCNFSLSSASNTSEPAPAFGKWVMAQMKQAGIRNVMELPADTGDSRIRVRQGRDFLLLGVMTKIEHMKKSWEMKLDREYEIYDTDGGYLGCMDRLKVAFDKSPLKLYSLFYEKPGSFRFSVKDAEQGEFLRMKLPELTAGRCLRLEILDSRGRKVFQSVFDRKEIAPHPAVAYTDPCGVWKARLTDVATGRTVTRSFEVEEND